MAIGLVGSTRIEVTAVTLSLRTARPAEQRLRDSVLSYVMPEGSAIILSRRV
jgi:hypothetical protein